MLVEELDPPAQSTPGLGCEGKQLGENSRELCQWSPSR